MTTNFTAFALNPVLQESLKSMSFETPTPIQALAIPLALDGRDVLGSAQTGTGKTGAFCVPMINYLMSNPRAHALVMLPTRELATQVHTVARQMIGENAKGAEGIKTALLIGGEPIGKQYAQLDRRPRLIVGTPGRINDHLRSSSDLVDRVSFVVLDEADRMLDMGFAPQIDTILTKTSEERQTLMFSATFPDNIVKFSRQYLNNPERVSAGTQSKPGDNIVQDSLYVDQAAKYGELIEQLDAREGSVIIFVRTQHGADKLADKLCKNDHPAEAIHGGLRQRQREKVLRMFRKNETRVLVATDVAARGLDVPHIEHVINYDLPQVAEDYIHRIGRTARAGAKGHAVSFISPAEKHLWRDIERLLNPDAAKGDEREFSRGPKKGGKKDFGRKPFDKKKPFGGKKKWDGEGKPERSEKPFGEKKFAAKKPFVKKKSWNPDGDFRRDEEAGAQPRGERKFSGEKKPFGDKKSFGDKKPFGEKKPFRKDGEFSSFKKPAGKKPFKKREDGFASDPDSYKKSRFQEEGQRPFKKKPFDKAREDRRDNDGERSFKKPFKKKDGEGFSKSGGAPKRDGNKKPFGDKERSREDRPFKGRSASAGGKPGGKRTEARGNAPFKGGKAPQKRSGAQGR